VLFSGTIAENIAYGAPQATRAEIVAAARKANCTFISDFVRLVPLFFESRLTIPSLTA
jgi:ABC-type multidrug transport system fused ATPase/permease subunit